MPNDVTVNWYEEDVILAAEGAMGEALLALAFQVEAEAKVKAAVDTGFMRNSSYVVGGNENTFHARSEEKDGREYNTVNSPEPAAPGGAVVGFAADYSIYVETQQPFLYPALRSVANQADATIEAVGKRTFG